MLNKNRSISLTLLITLFAILALASSVSALSHASSGVGRRDHTTLKRFVKKRADSSSGLTNNGGLAGQLIGAAAAPPTTPSTTPPIGSNTNGTDTSLTNTTSTSTTTSAATSATNTTSTTPLTNTSVSTTASANSTSTSTTSTSTSTSSSSSTTTTSSQTGQTPQPASPAPPSSNSLSSTEVTLTTTTTGAADAFETSAAPSTSNGSLSSSGKTTLITVLIVVAVSVGALAIIWTAFRKWKLGSSKKFDQRLQPINWEPTADDDVVPRRPSPDSASIRSGSEGHGSSPNLVRGLDHDFTAGPNHLAPIGGYADLARGPSPQPYMQEALSRGPSLTRPNYDASVPLHHQNNYGVQDTYGRY